MNVYYSEMRTIQFPFYVRLALVLFSIVLIYLILTAAAGIFIPLTFAFFFSVLLLPAATLLERRFHFSRSLAAMVIVVFATFLVAAFFYFVAVQFVSFSDDFPMLKTRFVDIFSSLQHWISYRLHITTRVQSDYLTKSASSMVESAAGSVKNVLFSVSTILLWTIFVILFTFFMLFHRGLLNRFILHLFSEQYRDKVSEITVETRALVQGYITALLIEMLVLSVVNSSLLLIIGIKYALLLGVMAAVLNIIPYLGMYSSILLSMLVTFANAGGGTAAEVGISLFCVHLVDSNFLMPRLVGGRVKMNPFLTILAVMVGEFTWGVPGMFLFIPLTGILKLIFERVDGLEAWGILIGIEEKEKKVKKIKTPNKTA